MRPETPPEQRKVWSPDGNGPTWAEYIEAKGLPWIPRIAAIAQGIADLEKMTHDWIAIRPNETEPPQTREDAPHGPITDDVAYGPGIEIPEQLRRADIRFILAKPGEKGAMETGWPTVANYPHGHVTLAIHTGRGHPYGCFPASGSRLFIIDADDAARLIELGALDSLPDTFTVASGSSTPTNPKAHLYYLLEGEPIEGKRVFFDPETGGDDQHLGEVFAQHPAGGKGFVIGPGSIHATTGRAYTVIRNLPIATLTREMWKQFSNAVRWQRERPPRIEPSMLATVARGGSLGALLGLTVDQVWPVPSDAEVSGEWRKFAHPVHGSANGNNLAIHTGGQVFYCHRCGSSGDALIALAVDAGIIHCEDARPGCLADRVLMEQVKDEARRRNYPVDEAERQQRIAYLKATMPPPYASVDVAAIRASIDETIRAAGARVEAER